MDRALSQRPGGPRFESRRLLSSFLLGTYGSIGSGKDRTKSEEDNRLGSNTKTEVELGDLVHIKCIAVTLLIKELLTNKIKEYLYEVPKKITIIIFKKKSFWGFEFFAQPY